MRRLKRLWRKLKAKPEITDWTDYKTITWYYGFSFTTIWFQFAWSTTKGDYWTFAIDKEPKFFNFERYVNRIVPSAPKNTRFTFCVGRLAFRFDVPTLTKKRGEAAT